MTTCCNHNCTQGRVCPVRQACELPEPSPKSLGLRSLWLHAARWYYRRALVEMGPLHRDVPHVVHKLADIDRELHGVRS